MNKRFTRSEFLFLTAYILWLLFAALKLTYLKSLFAFSAVNGYVQKVVILLLLLKFIEDDRYGIREIVGLGVGAAVYYISLRANAPDLVIPVCFVLSARNVDYRDIFKATMLVQLGVMAAAVLCALKGIIPNEIWYEEGRSRGSLGYTYCTYGSHISLFLTLLYIALRKRICLAETFALLAWNYIWYRVTDTRIDLLLCISVLAGCYVAGRLRLAIQSRTVSRLLYMLAAPFLAFGSILLQWYYDDSCDRWRTLNHIVNRRLKLGHDALLEYPITVWGQYIRWVGSGGKHKHPEWVYNYVDCSYLKYLLSYGILFFILLLVGLMLAGRMAADSRNLGLEIAYLAWLLYGTIDAELFVLSFQPFMLLLGYAFAQEGAILPQAGKITAPRRVIDHVGSVRVTDR